MRRIAFGLLLIGGLLTPAWAADARQQLDAFLQQVDTFQANFEQTLYDADSEPLQSLTGTVKLKRPGRFIWTYTGSSAQEIVADGERIWLYDKDLEQVTVNDIDERVSGTPLALLMDAGALNEAFDIVELGESDGINWLELSPKSEDSDFELVFIGLNDDGLAAMELRDNFGQATQIIFSQFESGLDFDDALFVFEIPPGVDVIGQETVEQ